MAALVNISGIGSQRGLILAHQAEHMRNTFTGYYHGDGPEYTAGSAPQEQVVPITLGIAAAPVYADTSALDQALRIYNEGRRLHNLHITYHNRGVANTYVMPTYDNTNGWTGYRLYAHNAVEATPTLIDLTAAPDLPTAATIQASLISQLATMANDILVKYDQGHRRNIKVSDGTTVVYHTAADTVNAAGTVVPLNTSTSTAAQVSERCNLLQRIVVAHLRDGTTAHSSADTSRADTLEAIVPSQGAWDWDAMMLILAGLVTAYQAHRADSGIHAAADSHNTIVATAPAYPATIIGANTLPRTFKTKYNLHLTAVDGASANVHITNDSAALSYSSTPANISDLIVGAADIWTKQTAHLRSAPGLAIREAV